MADDPGLPPTGSPSPPATPPPTGPRRPWKPFTDRFAFKPIALLLLVPVILASAGLSALLLAPTFAGAALGVHELDRRLEEAGADFTKIPRFPQRSTIYANDGKTELARIFLDNREIVNLRQVAPIAQDAVLAIEDATFFQHGAVNWTGMVRAVAENVRAGEIVQGGSTITQQLVKNTLGLDPLDQTLERKFQELALALRVEEQYSKERIFGMYLNQVYLGNGVYGIGTASEFYFKKPASDLKLTEAALLAGMIRAPEYFDPIDNPRKAWLRRNDVINRMVAIGMLEGGRAEKAKATDIRLANPKKHKPKVPPFFVTYMRDQIITDPNGWYSVLGDTAEERKTAISEGGLEIVTTLDPDWQEAAEEAANANWARQPLNPSYKPMPEVGIVSIQNDTGAIRTLLSGRNFQKDQKELATTGHQPGSSFKPFILASALEEGISPTDTYSGEQGTIPDPRCTTDGKPWTVINAEGSSRGYMTLAAATEDSVNAVFARLILDAGIEHTKEVAQRMGITTDIPAVCSMATGSVDVTPLEMASGYQTIANEGVHCRPYTIETIYRASTDEPIYEHEPECYSALKSAFAKEITHMLVAVVTSGTAADAFGSAWGEWPVAGKTGTADENKHVWFVGYTRQVSTSVWVGSPGKPYPLGNYWGYDVFGGSTAAPIWVDYMTQVMAGLRPLKFPAPVRSGVPNVVGMSLPQAKLTLREAKLGWSVTIVDSAQPEGTVVSQSPSGGSQTIPGSDVALEVSNGVAPISTVPNVVGMNSGVARGTLQDAGFFVRIVEEVGPNVNNHFRVVAQSPSGGTELLEGETVTITVAVPPPDDGGGGGGGGNGGDGGGGGGGNPGNGNGNGQGN
jgi:penicillin-binding protein 1A